VPAAAVIPAPIAYIKIAAVKKLVVGSPVCVEARVCRKVGPADVGGHAAQSVGALNRVSSGERNVYFEKMRVLKAGP
jgi:hypothetical protein